MDDLAIEFAIGIVTFGLMVALFRQGERLGDRDDDARVWVRVVDVPQPDGSMPVAVVRVENPGQDPVIVGLDGRRGTRLERLGSPVAVTVPRRAGRRRRAPGAVLGAVDGGSRETWRVPLGQAALPPSIRVLLYQPGGRTRGIRVSTTWAAASCAGRRS